MGLKLNFKLDPRTKIIILVLISFMVFNEVPLYISGILVLIPFICLFFSNRIGIALSYILMYIVAKIYSDLSSSNCNRHNCNIDDNV